MSISFYTKHVTSVIPVNKNHNLSLCGRFVPENMSSLGNTVGKITLFVYKCFWRHAVPSNISAFTAIISPQNVLFEQGGVLVLFWSSYDWVACCVFSSANLSRVVPHGLLVFFSSFTLMEKNLEFWRVSECFKRSYIKYNIQCLLIWR